MIFPSFMTRIKSAFRIVDKRWAMTKEVLPAINQVFNRVKIGIGRPKNGMSVVHHVLSKFDKDDYIGILQSIDKVDDSVNYYLQEKNFEKTMQRYNG